MADPAVTAFKLIRSKGRLDGVIRRPSADQVAGAKPWAPTDADPLTAPIIAESVAIVVLNQSDLADAASQSLAPDSTAMGLVACLELPAGAKIKLGDLVESAGDRYVVLRADLLAPSGIGILYTLSLKAR